MIYGHKTPDPVGSTYAGVVTHESVRITFIYAAVNNLDVLAADFKNSYLQASSSQKIALFVVQSLFWRE